MAEPTEMTPHVTLLQPHPDGSATAYAWHVDEKYVADMLAHMGEAAAVTVFSPEQIAESMASNAEREVDGD